MPEPLPVPARRRGELGLNGARIARLMHVMLRTGQIGFFSHHMGTTRMHPDPGEGVVDPDARVRGVSNLFVAGSSLFPTGGTAMPTLTIVALRCASPGTSSGTTCEAATATITPSRQRVASGVSESAFRAAASRPQF